MKHEQEPIRHMSQLDCDTSRCAKLTPSDAVKLPKCERDILRYFQVVLQTR